MLSLYELYQLTVFDTCGTLSKAAEELHLSQPTLTRSMQHLEEAFGVSLFTRQKNRIAFNATGRKAAACARALLADADQMVQQVKAFDERLRTVTVFSCAPAPLWKLLPLLSDRFADRTIVSRLHAVPDICDAVLQGRCEIGIVPEAVTGEDLACIPFQRERLSVCLPEDHPLAGADALCFAQLNGLHFLLKSDIGFWQGLCQDKMPDAHFLIQNDPVDFDVLARTSTLPCFTTNLVTPDAGFLARRRCIPITDPEADVTYHFICLPRQQDLCAIAAELAAQNADTPVSAYGYVV